MKRLYAILCAVVCLAVAATLWAEEPKKKGKWYDIFKGPPTLAAKEHQLRRERFEWQKKQRSGYINPDFEQAVEFDLHEIKEHLEKHQRAIAFLGEQLLDILNKDQEGDKQGQEILDHLYDRLSRLENYAATCPCSDSPQP